MDPSPARGPSPHRRGNGLPSADWGALVDLDPRLSEGLLERLAAAGVAAYVEPAGGTPDTLSRAVQVPGRPLDRLWVDPARADAAREVVGAEVADLSALLGEQEPGATAHGLVQPVPRTAARRVLTPPPLPGPPVSRATPPPASPDAGAAGAPSGRPAPGPVDDDEAWRLIVEGFDKSADSPVPPWPVEEDVDARRARPAAGPRADSGAPPAEDERPRRQLRRRTDPPAPVDPKQEALPGWVEPAALPDEGGYVPPPPPPVPRVQPRKLLAAASIVLGLLLLFAPGVLNQGATTGVGLLGLVLFAGGAGALVWWMRDAPPTDRGPDDGAVV
jgi:hypothetical protein